MRPTPRPPPAARVRWPPRPDAFGRGRAEGRIEGRAEGRAEGENRFAHLVSQLMAENRIDDLARAATDLEFRSELFKELGIS